MTPRKVVTLTEDNEHGRFLTLCSDVISSLNNGCTVNLELDFKDRQGIPGLIDNALLSWLTFPRAKRFLIVLDLDHRTEQKLMDYVYNSIIGSKSRGSWKIEVTDRGNNVIRTRVKGNESIIVILPLGLPDKLPSKIRRHSVEDYYLIQLPNRQIEKTKGDNSKVIFKQLVINEELDEGQTENMMTNSIRDHAQSISDYLRPLWHNEWPDQTSEL